MPHSKSDNLSQLLKTMKDAWSLITKRQALKSLYQSGFIGYIRKLEITHNQENGFNPHFHLIIFYEGSNLCDKEKIETTIFDAWKAAVKKKSDENVSQKHCSEIRQPKNVFAKYYGKSFFENNPYLLSQDINYTINILNELNREIYINSESIRVFQKSKELYKKLQVNNKENNPSIKCIEFNNFDEFDTLKIKSIITDISC